MANKNYARKIEVSQDRKRLIKSGTLVSLTEAETMLFISKTTSIPIPKILNFYSEKGIKYIEMERVEGDTLQSEIESNNPSEDDLGKIYTQLRGYVDQLRSIEGTYIGSVNNYPLNDVLFGMCGPFSSEMEYNKFVVETAKCNTKGYRYDVVENMLKGFTDHKIVFTHADLAPRNIIVKDKQVVAIVDWEFSGFYPEYSEFVKGTYGISWKDIWIRDIREVIPPYYIEKAVWDVILSFFM
jgi:aminoglycoside phosphotransferase